jgi:NAD+ diphosphatase
VDVSLLTSDRSKVKISQQSQQKRDFYQTAQLGYFENMTPRLSISSKPFARLVSGLKDIGKTCTVVESCCGGLINASLMAVPGSSSVFYGGSVAYNTKRAKKLLLDDPDLHHELVQPLDQIDGESEGDKYIRSKLKWTAKTAVAFCEQMDVDYAIAEGGAAGPTFRPEGLDKGFAVVAIAGRDDKGNARLLAQSVIRSTHANRQDNMRLFADAAAKLAAETIGIAEEKIPEEDSEKSASSLWLDRATSLRSDKKAIEALESRKDAKHVVLRNAQECLFASPAELALVNNVPSGAAKTFLGLNPEGQPIFGIDVDDSYECPPDTHFSNTRTHAPLLSPNENELAMYATAMAQWKKTHMFCSSCGNPTVLIDGGTCLTCSQCSAKWWPRQDPSIIVLVTNREGDKALLARSARHPKKVHTALAGFVEAGETFEMAVLREAYEETGVRVDLDSVTYLASQPWPFPRSCMIAFRATADDSLPLNIDTNELVSATWFEKSQVIAAGKVPGAVMKTEIAEQALKRDPSLSLLIPPKGVVARTLIDNWLEDA